MFTEKNKKIFVLLAFVAVLGTVTPVYVYAFENIDIVNSVQTSINTGGQSGSDGEDGRDGKDGQDGHRGIDGTSVVNGVSNASIYTKSTINNEVVVDFSKTVTTNGEEVVAKSHTQTVNYTQSDGAAEGGQEITDAERKQYLVQQIISSIHLILQKYVGIFL